MRTFLLPPASCTSNPLGVAPSFGCKNKGYQEAGLFSLLGMLVAHMYTTTVVHHLSAMTESSPLKYSALQIDRHRLCASLIFPIQGDPP
jgi:hypothetical protein